MLKRYLPALIVLSLLASAAAVLLATVDRDRRVPISHLNFDLSQHIVLAFDEVDPSVPHTYPAIVARVNGENLSGDNLMEQQVKLAIDRLGFEQTMEQAGVPDEEYFPLLDYFDAVNPLNVLIDDSLLRQAVLREGTLVSLEEAQEWLQDNEDRINSSLADDPERRAEMDAMMTAVGYPLRDWAADERIVEDLRMRRGIDNLGDLMCEERAEDFFERDPASLTPGHDCNAFLAAERAAADIEIYVRWVD